MRFGGRGRAGAGHLLPWAALLLLCISVTSTERTRREPKWWRIAKISDPSNLISNHIKSNYLGDHDLDPAIRLILRRKQRRLLRDNPGALVAVAKGARAAVHECQHQFRNRRWNCSTTVFAKRKTLFGKIVTKACREVAFLYALTSAAVTHTVTRACTEGTIDSCNCDYRAKGPKGIDWEWGGCSDNIDFGSKFARLFVDAGMKGRDSRFLIDLHNNEVGRLHVKDNMRKECKCHGMSGSCTVKTCWWRLPYFRRVGDVLKDRFDGASRVQMRSLANTRTPNARRPNRRRKNKRRKRKSYRLFRPCNPDHKPPSKKDLVYLDESPDFCVRNRKLGIIGTRGRECNRTSIGLDGCDLMCCGREYHTQVVEVEERCSCTFQWCCEVRCKTCKYMRTIHTCS
ncbi:protein Wnt-1-like [Eriocheir sinensis]|uniref:protein Wnt-1-like n=1 Tax=Eriocheir sinensis TaxID=95602 RepID=UPI0021CA931C|nr:protein Wnt-1-like [Eriocheir sinensis]XP_050732630.1 protein Wnt-1-like [Eriocheir sinensis]XP_050732631.1 protein Wnt-1-like [Eriocheir sinensis]